MAAVLPEWPIAQPLVVADDVSLVVTLNTTQDISGWQFDALVRAHPGGEVVTRFVVAVDATAKTITLTLPEIEAAKLQAGYGFDLRQTEPVNFTWLSVRSLNMIPSFSYETT